MKTWKKGPKKLLRIHNWIFWAAYLELPIWPKIDFPYWKLGWGSLCSFYFVIWTFDRALKACKLSCETCSSHVIHSVSEYKKLCFFQYCTVLFLIFLLFSIFGFLSLARSLLKFFKIFTLVSYIFKKNTFFTKHLGFIRIRATNLLTTVRALEPRAWAN